MMEELFAPALFDRLRLLARAFVWGRKSLHTSVEEDLRTAGAAHANLASEHRQTLQCQRTLGEKYAQLNESNSTATADLAKMGRRAETLELALNSVNATHTRALGDWAQDRHALERTEALLRSELAEKADAIAALQQVAAVQHDTHKHLEKQFESLQLHHGWVFRSNVTSDSGIVTSHST